MKIPAFILRNRFVFVLSICLTILNLVILVLSLPYSTQVESYCSQASCVHYAVDFSAFYEGAYRLIHNPSGLYTTGYVLPGDYPIYPGAQNFRYPIFFLIFIFPLLLVSYHDALILFDVAQFFLLPLVAFFLNKVMGFLVGPPLGNRKKILYGSLFFIALAEPMYVWQWALGQSRALQLFLLLLSFYLIIKNSKLSGVPFALASFDPRITILAVPLALLLAKKANSLLSFGVSTLVSICILFIPSMIYDNLWKGYYTSIITHDPFAIYAYEWIPILSVSFLTILGYAQTILRKNPRLAL